MQPHLFNVLQWIREHHIYKIYCGNVKYLQATSTYLCFPNKTQIGITDGSNTDMLTVTGTCKITGNTTIGGS